MKKIFLLMLTPVLVTTAFSPAQAQENLIYVAVAPCRVADTRLSSEGVINADTPRNFLVTGSAEQLAVQGGTANCVNPKAASGQKPVAIAAYILAVPNSSSTGKGVLAAYPSNQPPPPVGTGSTVNFAKDQTIGNTTIATVCNENCPSNGELAILARNTNEDVVVDVQGYFYPANAIDICVTADLAGNWQTFIAVPSLGWSSCLATINSSGKVLNGQCLLNGDSLGNVAGGQLQINGNCEVSGSLVVGTDVSQIQVARMSADRNSMTGIVQNGVGTTTFSAVRFN